VNNSQEKSSEDLSRQRKESTKLKTRQLKVLGLKSRKKNQIKEGGQSLRDSRAIQVDR
jgi:hypothetical protein